LTKTTESYYYQYKDAVMEAIGEDKMTCQEMSKKLNVHYNRIKWVMFRLRNEDHLTSYTYNDITYYLKPKPHPLQSIFGHTINFTEDQIKGSQIYNEKDAKHNLRFNTDKESFGHTSLGSEEVKIGT
jgi:transcription initiation factor IIE alpha subunit